MTLKCIAGIETPDEGEIILNNKILFDSSKNINLSPQDRNIGLLFQNYALFPNMTLKENILIGGRFNNIKNLEDKTKQLIYDFSLSGLENNYPSQLSGGQQQRVALARMIISNPKILMLDEPFSALDEHLKWQMEKVLIDLIKSYNGSILYVSHNKNEVYRLSDTIAVMNNGTIIETGSKKQIFRTPQKYHTAMLVGYKNISNIKISNTEVFFENWNLKIQLSNNIKDYKKAGIKEDLIKITPKGKDFKITNIIKNMDTYTIIVKNLNNKSYSYIEHSLDNFSFKVNDLVNIEINPDDIIFLK